MEDKYNKFNDALMKYHEKLVLRQEIIDWNQYQTKIANDKRKQDYLKSAANIKERDLKGIMDRLAVKQKRVDERKALAEQDAAEGWKMFNEEEANKKNERDKKKQRNTRKIELKKQMVVQKMIKHEE